MRHDGVPALLVIGILFLAFLLLLAALAWIAFKVLRPREGEANGAGCARSGGAGLVLLVLGGMALVGTVVAAGLGLALLFGRAAMQNEHEREIAEQARRTWAASSAEAVESDPAGLRVAAEFLFDGGVQSEVEAVLDEACGQEVGPPRVIQVESELLYQYDLPIGTDRINEVETAIIEGLERLDRSDRERIDFRGLVVEG